MEEVKRTKILIKDINHIENFTENSATKQPSVSKSQQRLFGQAYALKTGEIKRSDLDPRYAQEITPTAII
jgi:hypothetical protein